MNRRGISRRSLNLSLFRKRPVQYFYVEDFENTNEKICKKCDKDNDIIYARNSSLYTKTKKFLEKNNAIFKMEGPPTPPRVPSNYELYIIHKNRNSQTNNKIQTIAILYLLQNGYKLVIDPEVEFIPKVMNKDNKLFEPYMAIDIASSLNKLFIKDIAKSFQLNGTTLESPELLSIEEKITKFNKDGMIHYMDVTSETSTTDNTIINVPHNNQHLAPRRANTVPNCHFSDVATVQPRAVPILNPPCNTLHVSAPSAPPPENNRPLSTPVNVNGFYPSLPNESQPPAYSSDNSNSSGYGFEHEKNPDDSKINIFINK